MSSCNGNCSSCGSDCSERKAESLLAKLNPIAVVLGSLFISVLTVGANSMQIALNVPTSIVNVIQRDGHLHTEHYLTGMNEEEFEPVYEAISQVVKNETDIEYTLLNDKTETDDDGNPVYVHEYEIKANGKSIEVVVTYGDRENLLFSVKIK